MDYIDYRERLGIGFSDEEKQKIFTNKIKTFFKRKDVKFSKDKEQDFCDLLNVRNYIRQDIYAEITDNERLINILNQIEVNFKLFLSFLVEFINSCIDEQYKKEYYLEIKKILDDCHIQYDILHDKGKFFIIPKGAKELDDALVSEPLEWMKDYPKSRDVFVKALKMYADENDNNASEIADEFRKALETFFQEFFGCKNNFKTFKSEYGKYLGKQDIPGEISNNFATILDHYDKFNNNYAKHHDKTSANVLEYIMYETGNIIRLLIKLKKEEK